MKNLENTVIKDTTMVFEINGETIKVSGPRRFDIKSDEPVFDYDLDNALLEAAGNKYRETHQFDGGNILKFRKQQQLTQTEFANMIGISRKTLISYEKNYAIPSKHYEKLILRVMHDRAFYDQLKSTFTGMYPAKDLNILGSIQLKESLNPYNGYQNIDEAIIQNLILYFTNQGISQTRLQKAFFYNDFLNYQSEGVSLTGLYYRKMMFGPYSEELQNYSDALLNRNILCQKLDHLMVSNQNPDLSAFSKDQIDRISKIKNYIDNNSAKDVSEDSHEHLGWQQTELFEKISYDYALQMTDTFLTKIPIK